MNSILSVADNAQHVVAQQRHNVVPNMCGVDNPAIVTLRAHTTAAALTTVNSRTTDSCQAVAAHKPGSICCEHTSQQTPHPPPSIARPACICHMAGTARGSGRSLAVTAASTCKLPAQLPMLACCPQNGTQLELPGWQLRAEGTCNGAQHALDACTTRAMTRQKYIKSLRAHCARSMLHEDMPM
jgi:hypothetical protein